MAEGDEVVQSQQGSDDKSGRIIRALSENKLSDSQKRSLVQAYARENGDISSLGQVGAQYAHPSTPNVTGQPLDVGMEPGMSPPSPPPQHPVFSQLDPGNLNHNAAAREAMLGVDVRHKSGEPITESATLDDIRNERNSINQIDRATGVDRIKYHSSATHKAALYSPPITTNIDYDKDLPTWVHLEPEVGEIVPILKQMIKDAEPGSGAHRAAIKSLVDLESKGEESDVYKNYSDLVWRTVATNANRVKQKAVRAAFVPDDNEDADAVQARRMYGQKEDRYNLGGYLNTALDVGTFGFYRPLYAWMNSDLEESPLGKKLKELELYKGEADEFEKAERSSGALGTFIGGVMGLSPGSIAGRVIGKVASKAAEGSARRAMGAAGRVAHGVGHEAALTAGTSLPRRLLEVAVSPDQSLSDEGMLKNVVTGVLAETVVGAAADLTGASIGERASMSVGRQLAVNPELKAMEAAMGPKVKGMGDTGERIFSKNLTQDNIVGSSVRAAGIPTEPRGPGRVAADYAAGRLQPTVNKNFKAILDAGETDRAKFFSSGVAHERYEVEETFEVLASMFDSSSDNTSESVKKAAGKSLANISDVKVVDEHSMGEYGRNIMFEMDDPALEALGLGSRLAHARNRYKKEQAAYGQKPAKVTYVMLTPKEMDASGHYEALRDIQSQINFDAQQGGNSTALRRAEKAMRDDRQLWQGYTELMDREYKRANRLESISKSLGMTTNEISGGGVHEYYRGGKYDVNLSKLSNAINNVFEDSNASDPAVLKEFLENEELVALLRGVRAARAWERLNSTTKQPTLNMAISSSGNAYETVRAAPKTLSRMLYGSGRTLDRMYRSGKMPQAIRPLFTEQGKNFIENTSNEMLGYLESLLEEKESE